jgi:hypothetical protein
MPNLGFVLDRLDIMVDEPFAIVSLPERVLTIILWIIAVKYK